MVKGWDAVRNVGNCDLGWPNFVLVCVIILMCVHYRII